MNVQTLINAMRRRDCDIVALPQCRYFVQLPGEKPMTVTLDELKKMGTSYLNPEVNL